MSDLFHENVGYEFTERVWSVMAGARQHTFQVLTKRPKRMLEFSSGVRIWFEKPLTNLWLGVSVENQQTADERIPPLLETPAAVRFVSYEPALGPVDFSRYLDGHEDHGAPFSGARTVGGCIGWTPPLDWVIAGGESGPNARPSHPDWFRTVRDQCQVAGVPFFFKQWGEWLPAHNLGYRVTAFRITTLGDQDFERVGKKRAGRLLDGREWNEFPND